MDIDAGGGLGILWLLNYVTPAVFYCPADGKFHGDPVYLACWPSTNRDPTHLSSQHYQNSPVLLRSGRAVLFPLHPQYPLYSDVRPEYNGWVINADVYGDGGQSRAPWGSCGVY